MSQKMKKTAKKRMTNQKNDKAMVYGWVALGAFIVAAIATILGMARTIDVISGATVSKTPDAILASAGVTEESRIALPVSYFDQTADGCVDLYDVSLKKDAENRQFEWSNCGYHNKEVEQGIVEYELNSEHMPVASGGQLTSNRGVVGDSNGNTNFARWFHEINGESKNYVGVLRLDYNADNAEFSFHKNEFYPLDDIEYNKNDLGNSDGHNHLFTMSFATPFTVLRSGREQFEVVADDDTFVFIGDKMVVDMGGIHGATAGRFTIHEDGEVYSAVDNEELAFSGIVLDEGEDAIVRIFHADRDSENSVFNVRYSEMDLAVVDAKLADNDDETVLIAYDPSDPTYVAPLGESLIIRPDSTRGLIIMVTIEGVMVVALAVFVSFIARFMIKSKAKRKK